MPEQIKVAVVDDHPLVREGIIHALTAFGDITVVGQGGSAGDAVRLIRTAQPDILLLDLSIPGLGLVALAEISSLHSPARAVILTVSEDSGDVLEALRRGASGYVLKGISGADLAAVLRRVHQAELYVSPELGGRLLSSLSRHRDDASGRASISLSSRERDIFRLVRRGCCNKEITNTLRISEKTVKHYMTGIFRKSGVRNRTELALLPGADPAGAVQSHKRDPASQA